MNRYDWTGVTPALAESRMEDEAVKRVPDLAGEDPAAFPHALLAELGAGTILVGNVRSYGATGDGSTDDTAAIQACIDENEVIYFPSGNYVVSFHKVESDELVGRQIAAADLWKVGLLIPAGRRLVGAGHSTIIRTKLLESYPVPDPSNPEGPPILIANDAANIHATSAETEDANAGSWFFVDWGAHDVEFNNLRFLGDVVGNVTPTTLQVNNQMAVIELGWQGGHSGGIPAPNNLKIMNCWFEKQYGFTVHQRGGGSGYQFVGNRSIDCMNGVNVNSDRQANERNYFERAEGFESTGQLATFRANMFKDVFTAISAGGNMSDDVRHRMYGCIIEGNTVDGSLHSDPANPYLQTIYAPPAIAIADNQTDVIFADNTVHKAAGVGLSIHSVGGQRPVQRVQVVNCGFLAARHVAIQVPGRVEDLVLENVQIMDQTPDGTIIHRVPLLTGSVSSTGAQSLTDTSQSMVADAFAGRSLRIVSGSQKGVERVILSNTDEVYSLDEPWDTAPEQGALYEVLDDFKTVSAIVLGGTDPQLPVTNARLSHVDIRITGSTKVQLNPYLENLSVVPRRDEYQLIPVDAASDPGTLAVDARRYGRVHWVVRDAGPKTVNEPLNGLPGDEITYVFENAVEVNGTGATMGAVAFNDAFRLAQGSAFTSPGPAGIRMITFRKVRDEWMETARSSVDL